jgi:hypothetical protein
MEREVEGDLAILGVLGEHAGHHEVGLVDRDQVLGLLVRHASLRIKNVTQSEARAYFSITMGGTPNNRQSPLVCVLLGEREGGCRRNSKGVGPSTTLPWPGWKQPDIAVKVDRHDSIKQPVQERL